MKCFAAAFLAATLAACAAAPTHRADPVPPPSEGRPGPPSAVPEEAPARLIRRWTELTPFEAGTWWYSVTTMSGEHKKGYARIDVERAGEVVRIRFRKRTLDKGEDTQYREGWFSYGEGHRLLGYAFHNRAGKNLARLAHARVLENKDMEIYIDDVDPASESAAVPRPLGRESYLEISEVSSDPIPEHLLGLVATRLPREPGFRLDAGTLMEIRGVVHEQGYFLVVGPLSGRLFEQDVEGWLVHYLVGSGEIRQTFLVDRDGGPRFFIRNAGIWWDEHLVRVPDATTALAGLPEGLAPASEDLPLVPEPVARPGAIDKEQGTSREILFELIGRLLRERQDLAMDATLRREIEDALVRSRKEAK